jgi:hypothetical protein
MKVRVSFVHFGSARGADMFHTFRWSALFSCFHGLVCFGHSSRKWRMLSSHSGQWVHLGVLSSGFGVVVC